MSLLMDDDGLLILEPAERSARDRARSNHTGTQAIATVDDLQASLDSNATDAATAQATANAAGSLAATKARADAIGIGPTDADMGTFTGATIPDSQTAKQALQALETAVEDDGYKVIQYGAVGDGTTDDSTPFSNTKTAADVAGNSVYIGRDTYNISTTEPDFDVHGDGFVKSNAITAAGGNIRYNPAREAAFFNPATYQREAFGINYPPPRGPAYTGSSYNTVFSPGSNLDDRTKTIRFNDVFGTGIGIAPGVWGYNDVFGGNAMAYAHYVSRNTVVGSESMAWAGAPNQEWLRTYQHDFWRKPSDNLYEPGEVGWNSAGLETKFPGIGDRLAAYADYATTEDETAYNATWGRDAGVHIIKGIRNVFGGYQSAAHMFDGSYNVGIGALALQSAVFAEANTAVGDQAGRDCLDSLNAVFLGYAAGRTVQDASGGVFLGDRAADGVLSAEGAVIIGQTAGQNHGSALDDIFAVGNAPFSTRAPLISGNFVDGFGGVGVIPGASAWYGQWHVRMSAVAGADSSSVSPWSRGLVLERASDHGLTILTGNTNYGQIIFADPDSINPGGIQYDHAADQMKLRVAGLSRLQITGAGTGFNGAAPLTKPTGWGAPTGTATRTTFATGSVTTAQLAERVKALIDNLISYGLIGA